MAYDSAANKDLLYGRQGGVCVGCRLRFPQRNMTVDHIRPQSMGGGHGIGNLQLLCAACNSLKGAGSHEALIAKLLAAGVIVLTRRGKYAPAGGRGSTMGPVAIAVLVAAIPYVVDGVAKAVEKGGPPLVKAARRHGPTVVRASKRGAKSACRICADGAGRCGRGCAAVRKRRKKSRASRPLGRARRGSDGRPAALRLRPPCGLPAAPHRRTLPGEGAARPRGGQGWRSTA